MCHGLKWSCKVPCNELLFDCVMFCKFMSQTWLSNLSFSLIFKSYKGSLSLYSALYHLWLWHSSYKGLISQPLYSALLFSFLFSNKSKSYSQRLSKPHLNTWHLLLKTHLRDHLMRLLINILINILIKHLRIFLFNTVVKKMREKKERKRVYIERNREADHICLWNDYFSETPTYPENLFRWRFRMNKPLFVHIVDRLSNEVQFFHQKKDGLGRLGLFALQNCTQQPFVSWLMMLRLIRSTNTSDSGKLQLGHVWKNLWNE